MSDLPYCYIYRHPTSLKFPFTLIDNCRLDESNNIAYRLVNGGPVTISVRPVYMIYRLFCPNSLLKRKMLERMAAGLIRCSGQML